MEHYLMLGAHLTLQKQSQQAQQILTRNIPALNSPLYSAVSAGHNHILGNDD